MNTKILIILIIVIILGAGGFLLYRNIYEEDTAPAEETGILTEEKSADGEMGCEEYCKAKTHDDCIGYWEISGTYPNCVCNFKCGVADAEAENVTTKQGSEIIENEEEGKEPQAPENQELVLEPRTDWPVFQGNSARTGSAESAIPQNPKFVWQLTVGDFRGKGIDPRGINRPIVYNNKIFVSASEVAALSLATGDFIWQYKQEGFYPGNIAAGDGKVFVVFNDSSLFKNMNQGFIYALDEKTGDFLWKYQTQKSISHSTPLFESNKVFVGDDSGNLYTLDSKTGELLWKKFLDAEVIHSSPAFYKGMIYVGTEGTSLSNSLPSHLFALDAGTGGIVWKFQVDFISGKLNLVHGTPAVSDDVVYFGSESGYFYALAHGNGELIWKKKIAAGDKFMCGVSAPPALSKGKIFITTWEGNLFSLNQEDGEILWQKPFDASGQGGDAAAITGSGLVCITVNEKFSCLNEDNGGIAWQKQFFGGTPAASSGLLIVPNMGIADGSLDSTPVLLVYKN